MYVQASSFLPQLLRITRDGREAFFCERYDFSAAWCNLKRDSTQVDMTWYHHNVLHFWRRTPTGQGPKQYAVGSHQQTC